MEAVLVFAGTLLLAVLVSRLAQRTVLSTAVLFLLAGFLGGEGMLGVVRLTADSPVVTPLVEIALFAVLFTDGMRASVRDVASAWRLPGRALLMGLPLTLLGVAVLARTAVGLPWPEALLLGAALSATDPVLASAIVGREDVPFRVRHLLNVESSLNDGLALPVVVVMLAVLSPADVKVAALLGEVALGVVLGVTIPWMTIRLEESRLLGASPAYAPLLAFGIGLAVLSAASVTHANLFLAAFTAGITVGSVGPDVRRAFHEFGESVTELLKLAALLVFGALVSPALLGEIGASGYAFAGLVLLLVRPAALAIALAGSRLSWPEWIAAAWFGPKGFASVVYGLLIVQAGIARGDQIYHLVAMVTAGSIVAHSSTDVLVARWLRGPDVRGSDDSRRGTA